MADGKKLNQEAQEQRGQKDKDFNKQNKKPTDDEQSGKDKKENEAKPEKMTMAMAVAASDRMFFA